MPHDSQRRRKRPTGSPPPAVQGPIGGWRVVDRTREAIEKGIAYILTGQHLGRKPPETPEKPPANGPTRSPSHGVSDAPRSGGLEGGKPTPKPGDIYEIEDDTSAIIITGVLGPGREKKHTREPPKASPTGDEHDHCEIRMAKQSESRMDMMRKKGERPPTADEMRAQRLDVLRANPPKPRKGESPEGWKQRLDSYRKEIREVKKKSR